MTEETDKYLNPNYWPIFSKEGTKNNDKGENSAGFYIQTSKILLRFYRRKTDTGKYVSSPYESLVFGVIYNFTVSTNENSYGYMSMSIDELAWELGASYNTIKNAINNLLNDGFIVKTEKNKKDKTKDTIAYATVMNRLIELRKETRDITFDNDKTYPKRKPRDYSKKTKREIELERLLAEAELKLRNQENTSSSSDEQNIILRCANMSSGDDVAHHLVMYSTSSDDMNKTFKTVKEKEEESSSKSANADLSENSNWIPEKPDWGEQKLIYIDEKGI